MNDPNKPPISYEQYKGLCETAMKQLREAYQKVDSASKIFGDLVNFNMLPSEMNYDHQNDMHWAIDDLKRKADIVLQQLDQVIFNRSML